MNSAKAINILNISFGESKIVKEECYPYLAYINNAGNPKGTMFDSFLFDFSKGETLEAWEADVDALFNGENGIRALDCAVADVKGLLNLPKEKCIDVYVKAPLPKISLKPFGDINRDGVIEKLLDTEDCLAAFSLFVATFLRNFNISQLKNLTVKGWVLDLDGKEEIRNLCKNHLTEKGFAVYGGELELVNLSATTDFSAIAAQNGGVRLFVTENEEFLLDCAFSQNQSLRKVYDSLYILLNPEKFLEPVAENKPEEVTAAAVEENSSVDEEIEAVETISAQELVADIDAADELPDEVLEEIIEKLVEELPELDPSCNSETDAEINEDGEDIRVEITKEPSEEEGRGKISVEISITEEKIPGEEEDKPQNPPTCKLNKNQKRTLLGAGIAAAAMGVAYLINRAKKEL